MDKIVKALKKLSTKEKVVIENVLMKIKRGIFPGLDLKKLKIRDDIYRVRKGKIRIIFRKQPDGQCMILAIERRLDRTYNK